MNEPLVKIENGEPVTSSIHVAEFFEKKHQHVMAAIRTILAVASDAFSRSNFRQREYQDRRGKMQPCYALTQDGFAMTALGFTGTKAMQFREAYVIKFREMANKLQDSQIKHLESRYVRQLVLPNDEAIRRESVGMSDACKYLRILGVHLTLTPGQLKGKVKRGELEGHQDERGHWKIYVDQVTKLATGH